MDSRAELCAYLCAQWHCERQVVTHLHLSHLSLGWSLMQEARILLNYFTNKQFVK